MSYRIGYGEDIHALVTGRPLILGGVRIPFEKGLLGHSDGDALLHAIADAILGALGLGDIGKHFPPSDMSIKGIDSRIIVNKCVALMREAGYKIANLDCSVAAEAPRLAPHIEEMKKSIGALLDSENVSVKAMTNEGFDAVGKGLAIRAVAVVLLEKE